VLNYCRTLAYLEEGSLISKVAGGLGHREFTAALSAFDRGLTGRAAEIGEFRIDTGGFAGGVCGVC